MAQIQLYFAALPLIVGLLLSSRSSQVTCSIEAGNLAVQLQEADELQCPYPWFFKNLTTQRCDCGPSLPGIVQCNQETKEVWLKLLFCMTYDNVTGITLVGECPFGGLHKTGALKDSDLVGDYALLPQNITKLNEQVCGRMNRNGPLCSRCKPGNGPTLLSYTRSCTKCSNSRLGLFMFLMFACVPTTVFFLIIMFCQVHVTSAPLNFFIFASQLVSVQLKLSPQLTLGYSDPVAISGFVILSFFGVWNLDFFRIIMPPICISESLTELQALCLDYVVAIYPLLLIVMLYICIQQHARGCRILVCLWRPFAYCLYPLRKRFNWNPADSLVHVFASFLLLSSTKILFVSLSLLKTVKLYAVDFHNESLHLHNSTNSLLYDPSVSFFSRHHLPYALLALCVSSIFVVLPCFILVMYPTRCFQKCLNYCGIRWHAIHVFADAFNGCYRDGRNGTHDCRCFAGFYLCLRILYPVIYNFNNFFVPVLWLHIIAIIAGLLTMAIIRPYKSKVFNAIDVIFLTIIAIMFTSPPSYYGYMTIAAMIILVMYFIGYVHCKVIFKLNCRYSPKLKAFADKLSENSNNPRTEREYCGSDEGTLPDRVLNPERYTCRHLSEVNEEENPLLNSSSGSNIPTYGIV